MHDEEDDEDDFSGSGERKSLTDEQYLAAKELYELGKGSLANIATELGCSRQALSKRFRKDNIVKDSRVHEANEAKLKIEKAVAERFAERRAEFIEEVRLSGLSALKQARLIGQKIVVDQVRSHLALSGIDDDLRALGRYNKILVDNIQTSLSILNADEHIDEDDLPILTIEDLTNEDVLNHHKMTGALDEDAEIEDLDLE